MSCQDINGNTVNCTDPSAIYSVDSSGYLTPNNPVSILASSPSNNGGSALSSIVGSLGGLATSISQAVGATPTVATRPTVSVPLAAGATGSTGLLLVVAAIVIAFFALHKPTTA